MVSSPREDSTSVLAEAASSMAEAFTAAAGVRNLP
jgi:hypothetical protein